MFGIKQLVGHSSNQYNNILINKLGSSSFKLRKFLGKFRINFGEMNI